MHKPLQDDILPVIMEEIDGNEEIVGNVDTNIASQTPALISNMSTSGTGTPRPALTEHESGLHQIQDIHTEDGNNKEVPLVFSDLLPITQSADTVLESEDEVDEYAHDSSNDHMFNESKDARVEDSLNEVMVTRNS